MIKKTKRKAFNFLRSYFDVFNELTNDKDKLDFLTAIINKQFLNEDPIELNFIVNLCYESQRHQIETSVKGWLRATKEELSSTLPTSPMTTLPTSPMTTPMTNGKEEEEKEEVKEEEKEKIYRAFKHLKLTIDEFKKLNEVYLKEDIEMVLNNIENYKSNNKYSSLYLTSLNWLKKDYKTKEDSIKNQYKISV